MATLATIWVWLLVGNFSPAVGYHWASPLQSHPGERYQSAHFVLVVSAGQDAGRLLDELEYAYRAITAYGFSLPDHVTANCYGTTAEFVRNSGGNAFHLALASGEQIHLQPVRVLAKRGELAQALRHELAHIALVGAARRGLPRWLNEGMAMTVAGEQYPEAERFRGLKQLEDSLVKSRSYRTLRSAYGVSARLVGRLLAGFGKEKLMGMLRAVAVRGNFEECFQELAGRSLSDWGKEELLTRR